MRIHFFAALAILIGLSGRACDSTVVPPPDDDPVEEPREEFTDWKFGLFLHFNIGTFTERDWANGYEDPATFTASKLDAGQWAEAAKEAGMTYGVLTAKHTGGWALWDSRHTVHDATAFVNFKNGQGDVVREYVEAFRAHGLKVGLYYLLPGDYDNRFGNQLPPGKPSLHGFPPEARGDYGGFAKKQLTELLTNYGPIDLIWIDQWASPYTTAQGWQDIRKHIKSLQPETFVIANNARDSTVAEIHSYELPYLRYVDPDNSLPPPDNAFPAEINDIIGPTWFWNPTHDRTPMKSAEDIVEMVRLANSRNANYLLNVVPDTTGLMPPRAVERLREIGALLRAEQ